MFQFIYLYLYLVILQSRINYILKSITLHLVINTLEKTRELSSCGCVSLPPHTHPCCIGAQTRFKLERRNLGRHQTRLVEPWTDDLSTETSRGASLCFAPVTQDFTFDLHRDYIGLFTSYDTCSAACQPWTNCER